MHASMVNEKEIVNLLLNKDKNKFDMSYGGDQIIDEYGSLRGNKPAKNFSGSIFKNLLLNYEINMQSVMLLRSYTISENLSFPFISLIT